MYTCEEFKLAMCHPLVIVLGHRFFRSPVAKDLPWGGVNLLLDFIDIALSNSAHVGIPWKEPSDNPVRVLDPSLLIRGIRIAEEGLEAICLSELEVARSFTSVVEGDSFPNRSRKRFNAFCKGFERLFRRSV